MAVRYGRDSRVCQGIEAVGSGIAASSSASSRVRMVGFERMWYVVVLSVCAVVRVPAATRVRASPRRRGMDFSEGGRLGSSRRVWKIVEWLFESEVSERTARIEMMVLPIDIRSWAARGLMSCRIRYGRRLSTEIRYGNCLNL